MTRSRKWDEEDYFIKILYWVIGRLSGIWKGPRVSELTGDREAPPHQGWCPLLRDDGVKVHSHGCCDWFWEHLRLAESQP